MADIDDGGPAYPVLLPDGPPGALGMGQAYKQHAGLSLRDHAAIAFGAAILANPAHHEYLHDHYQRACIALNAADAFLKARKEEEHG